MGLALKGCLKIGGASKRGSQENGGGGKKVVEKKGDSVIPYLICDRHDFFASIFFHPHRFLATSFFATPPLFCTLPFLPPLLFCHFFFVTSFFRKSVFGSNSSSNKIFLGVAKKRWQKRGDKKEVVQRWQRLAKVGVAKLGVAKKRWQKRGDKKEVVQR